MRFRLATIVAVIMAVALSYTTGRLHAQLPIPASTQFDITGFLQEATVDNIADPHSGGTLKVNGHVVIVPKETVVEFPANQITWQEVFAQAPAPYTGRATGMASADLPAPLSTYEVHVIGNRVINGASDQYIAGLVFVSQQGLNSGQGFINFIDYTTGDVWVGAALGAPGGVRLRLNDPTGRYGRAGSPDVRFTVDADNPTISAGSGYPMCVPRTAPVLVNGLLVSDSLCPETNRQPPGQGVQTSITMNLPGANYYDPLLQAPMEVGDYITYAGTLVKDCGAQGCASGDGPTVGPWPGTANTYIAVHTIESNVAIFTQPGVNPAYVRTDVALIGTGGLTVLGAGEAVIRTRFEGMSTDPSRIVHLYGIDINPTTGATTDRDWGTIGVDPGPPNGAVKGRWRFRPPCLAFGTVPTKPDKQCVGNSIGTFLPPTREMRAVVEGMQSQVAALNANDLTKTAANGLFYGQYHAPIFEYIFPENVPGSPIVENNFNTIDFLALGGVTSSSGVMVGQLNPWPSFTVPAPACTAPVASAGGPYTVAASGTVSLSGSFSGTAPVTLTWAASAGSFDNVSVVNPVFTAPSSGVVSVSLTASNSCGSNTASSSVTVNALQAPTVTQVAPVTVSGGSANVLLLSGTDPNSPAKTPLTFTVTQAPANGGPSLLGLTVTQAPPTGATVSFTAPVLAAGTINPAVVNLSITAKNSAGISSAASTTTVTVLPPVDTITITTAQYRTGKQRIDLTVADSLVSPNIVLKLQPYVARDGTIFDPAALGNTLTNNGGGGYVMTLVGAPPPACGNPTGAYATPCPTLVLQVKSNVGGASPMTALTSIRQ